MQLNILAAAVLALAPLASACKCVGVANNPSTKWSATKTCCETVQGTFSGDDCQAHSIRKMMHEFHVCCAYSWDSGLKSDCNHGTI